MSINNNKDILQLLWLLSHQRLKKALIYYLLFLLFKGFTASGYNYIYYLLFLLFKGFTASGYNYIR